MASALASQRADLERRRDYMEALLQNATTGVVSTDRDGRIVTMNPAARILLQDAGATVAIGQSNGNATNEIRCLTAMNLIAWSRRALRR